MIQTGIFKGRVQIPYAYGRYGWTRGGGKTWHGGIDLVGLDDPTICMPYYTAADGAQKAIRGTVTRARIVTDHSDKTWEWGWYICVQLDAAQTPDEVNFLYFCHCARLLVQAGQKVQSGDALAVMGNSGNAALNDPPYKHCHLEVRATSTGVGLDPTRYSGAENAVGTYGTAAIPVPAPTEPAASMETIQLVTLGPLTVGEASKVAILAGSLLLDEDRYSMLQVDASHFAATMTVSNGDAMRFLALAQSEGWDSRKMYHSRFVG
ncbi:M23 family metallopeptidase [Subdoligranulum variabile]|uniref:Peptidase, M23 family n=1 Tax=Subdoligranulum variabile DSM 15176 TaxID=411471 RepID=D1PRE6_9FIRM|nr:M23 family metallopeptidase [Subdoligranulum variabile]EFB74672.1 peptidase, M23 family [Subdoligranulum variabile DSM 15176]UWP69422.1 M23 family metallopeptidase [Subdoligranulum variabile]